METPTSLSIAARRALRAVAASGTFAAAARSLGQTQPAVSQQIRALEKRADAVLFERSNGRLKATLFCIELLDIVQEIEELEDRAARLLERRRAIAGGMIRVALGNSMPGMALISAFQRLYPGVQVSVALSDYASTINAVVNREVDIGVLPDLPPDSRFVRETLIEQDVVAMVHPDDPLAMHTQLTCSQLMRSPLVFRSHGSSTQRIVDSAFSRQGLKPTPRLVLDTRDGVYEAVVNRLGIGFMWRHGTTRTDQIKRIPVVSFKAPCPESVFRLADSKAQLIDAFFATARAYGQNPATSQMK